MPQYDRQLIIQFLSGSPEDNLIKEKARALDKRARHQGLKSKIVTMPYTGGMKGFFTDFRTSGQLAKVTADTRLYLQGHGCWQSQKLGLYDGEEAADYLGGMIAEVKTISILGCQLGRDLGTDGGQLVTQSANSFASKFHARLKEGHNVETVVTARVLPVGIMNQRWLEEMGGGDDDEVRQWSGRKMTFFFNDKGEIDFSHKQKHSKLVFWWEGGRQMRRWAY